LTFNPETAEGAEDGDQFQTISVAIIDDTLFEQYERAVLYISSVSNNNLGYPRLHVINIFPSDEGNIPEVAFADPNSSIAENASFHRVPVVLNGTSGAPAWVDFEITGGTAPQNTYSVSPSDGRLYFNLLDDANRTTAGLAEILITEMDNEDLTGPRTIELTLINPYNASLGSPYIHTITLIDDEECNITFANPVRGTNSFSVDLINSTGPLGAGIDDYLSWINISFTHSGQQPNLLSVDYKGSRVANGDQVSPVFIPSATFPWLDPVDLSIPVAPGIPRTLNFTFSNNRASVIDVSVDFVTCDQISIRYP
jgi:hypothetical protein